MRLSWAQGAVAALTLTAAVGLLDTPSRLLGPASVVESPLSLPQASSPSIVIAALPAPIVHSSARHAPSRHAALIAAPPPSLAVGPVVRLPVPVQPQAPQPKAAKPAALPTPRRRIPSDEPRPSPAPTPVPPPPAP